MPSGHSAPSPNLHKQLLVVSGIQLDVFSEPPQTQPGATPRPVAVMFLLHGRNGSAARMEQYVHAIFGHFARLRASGGKGAARDLIIVTFDQRNHGRRLVDKQANMGWSEDPTKDNPRHAIDMYAMYTGTAADVSHLIDFLPSYLFPNGERTIEQWLCAGRSLGGHATWIVLKNDPRVTIGIPIIGCPDYLTLISKRAKAHKLPAGPPYLPAAFSAHVARTDAAAAPYAAHDAANPFLGKKVLVLSGADDRIVPWSSARGVVERLEVGAQGVKEVFVEPGIGHDFSPAMVERAASFIWERALLGVQSQE